MEICKTPSLRLKALNKHTHIMYIEMENVIKNKKKKKKKKKKKGFKHDYEMQKMTKDAH